MAKYSFSVEVDSGLKPAGENDFPLARAKDIVVDDNGKRLSEKLPELELPKVTTADNGKVLAVVAGQWSIRQVSEGVSSWNELTDKPFGTIPAKTVLFEGASEPLDSLDDGEGTVIYTYRAPQNFYLLPPENTILGVDFGGNSYIGHISEVGTDYAYAEINGADLTLEFDGYHITLETSRAQMPSIQIYLNTDVTVKLSEEYLPETQKELPAVSAADNGKVLSVVNGAWAAATPASGGGGGVSSWNELTDKPFGDNADGTVKQIDNKYLAPIVFNSGYEEIRPEVIFSTVMNSDFGVYYNGVSVGQELYDRWQANTDKVRVTFDGTVYECTPQSVGGYYGVGNGVPFGGTGNNEPFVVTIAPDNGAYYLTCFCLQDTAPTRHYLTVELYEEEYKLREEYLPMDAIKKYVEDYINEALGGDY